MSKIDLMPKFAVLLAAYNGSRWIEEQISTILSQINVELEVFVSIDPSSDGTKELVEKLYKDNERVHILEDSLKFGGAAKNFYRVVRDVDFSRFDYISFSDQDDIWSRDKLHNGYLKLKTFDAYSSNVVAFWESKKTKLIDKAQEQTCCDYLFEAASAGSTYILSQKVATHFKEFLIHNWDEVNQIELHDWFIYAFSRANGYKWYIDKHPMLLYRQHSTNQVGVNYGLKAFLKRVGMIKSGWYRGESIKIITVLNLKNRYKFTPYIMKKSFLNNLLLLRSIFKFRRKLSDKIFFLLIIAFMIY